MTAHTREDIERTARIARVLVDAALRNVWVRDYIDNPDPKWPGLWTDDRVRQNPPVRVEFEHAYGLGGLGETLAACRNKATFGQFLGVFPVDREDPVGELNIMYVFKESSPYNRRVLQRRYLKLRLGRGWRKLVSEAMYHPKGRFLSQVVTPDAAAIIRMALRMDAGRFWRVVRGKEWIDIPKPRRQPLLFADEDGGRVPLPLA
jgi:hypothetical protein